MSGVVRAIKKVVKKAFTVVKKIGKVITNTVEKIGDVVEEVASAVGNVVENIVEFARPLIERYAIQAALIAAGIPPAWAPAMSSGLHTLANGGSPEDALKASATTIVLEKVGKNVTEAAMKSGFTAAQAAAAASAAQSAVATAAYGGDINDVLKAAAIGSIGSAAGSIVMDETGSRELAVFTSSALSSVLRGQKLDQAILNGASAATVNYLKEIYKESDRANDIIRDRDKAYDTYIGYVDKYNKLVEQYNAATTQAQVNKLEPELIRTLNVINGLSDTIGDYNQKLADIQVKVSDLTARAADELANTADTDYTQNILDELPEEEQALADQIASTAEDISRGGGGEVIDVAVADTGTTTDVTAGTTGRIPITGVYGTLVETPTRTINAAGIIFDKATGNVVGELTEDELRDLRISLGLATQTGDVIGQETLYGGEAGPIGTESDTGAITLTDQELTELTGIAGSPEGVPEGTLTGGQEGIEFDIDAELDRLEEELAQADEETAQRLRDDFADRLVVEIDRLEGRGTDAEVPDDIAIELEQLINDYRDAKDRAKTTETTGKEEKPTKEIGGGYPSDEEIIDIISGGGGAGGGTETNVTGGGTGGTGAGGGGAGGGGTGGGGAGTGAGTEEELVEFTPGETVTPGEDTDTNITTTAVVTSPEDREARTISTRVTGEALTGILGEKEPLFGGDEDKQRAVWNRRSLRLRRALGL